MIVSNPSNFARLIDLYGGHVYDERDAQGKVIQEGVVDILPDMEAMREDLYSISVSNPDHYRAQREVYERFGIIIEPHGAVGWRALDTFLGGKHERLAVIYETADPGKFPDDRNNQFAQNLRWPFFLLNYYIDSCIRGLEDPIKFAETETLVNDRDEICAYFSFSEI